MRGSIAASASIRAEGHHLQCAGTGPAHELHDDAHGDADRCRALAFEKAMPSKVAASWGHANGLNVEAGFPHQ